MELDRLPSTVMPLPVVTLTFDLLTPKSNQHIYELNTSVTKIGWNSLHWFLRYNIHKVFGMHRHAHGRTHPRTACLQHHFSRSFFLWSVAWTVEAMNCLHLILSFCHIVLPLWWLQHHYCLGKLRWLRLTWCVQNWHCENRSALLSLWTNTTWWIYTVSQKSSHF